MNSFGFHEAPLTSDGASPGDQEYKSYRTQCSQGCQVFGKKFCQNFLPQYYETVLWQKNFYLLRAVKCHKMSLIGIVWFVHCKYVQWKGNGKALF